MAAYLGGCFISGPPPALAVSNFYQQTNTIRGTAGVALAGLLDQQ